MRWRKVEEVEEERRGVVERGISPLPPAHCPRGRRIDPEAAAVIRPLIKCQSPTHPVLPPPYPRPCSPSAPSSSRRMLTFHFTLYPPARLAWRLSLVLHRCRRHRRRPFYTQFALNLLRAPRVSDEPPPLNHRAQRPPCTAVISPYPVCELIGRNLLTPLQEGEGTTGLFHRRDDRGTRRGWPLL